MIYGIGSDIVAVGRFQKFLDSGNSAIICRLFSLTERSHCDNRKDAASCLSARFAAKEAFLKALGTGLRDGISWHDMEVFNDSMGKPEMKLSGKAKEQFQLKMLTKIHLTMSHDSGNAIAMVVLESSP
ncbi:MAG: holo-[acyl-carrier-protein] synthase [Desulfuromonadaceae bacterium]|nr:holo-[acyl-carrier-protein] synthase [Desulfuromonadaceae bacterium]MDD2854733.1 holo-[acyl-carrier-protein] synthase [Desulfuromonadaceae bacterium]